MEKLLIVDDEEPMRRLLRLNLSDKYEIYDTGDPEQALALAMQNKPDAILLDLRMPKFSGFELCRTFNSLTSTQLIPLVVVSGEAGSTTKALCRTLAPRLTLRSPSTLTLYGRAWQTFCTRGEPNGGAKCACGYVSI